MARHRVTNVQDIWSPPECPSLLPDVLWTFEAHLVVYGQNFVKALGVRICIIEYYIILLNIIGT